MDFFKLKDYCDSDFPFAITRSHGFSDRTLHKHDYSELVIIFNGKGVHFMRDHEFFIETGDVFVIPKDMEHGYKDARTVYLTNLMFNLDKLEPRHDLRQLPAFHTLFQIEPAFRKEHGFKSRLKLSNKALAYVQSLTLKIQDEMEHKLPGHKTLSKALVMELLTFLCRYTPTDPSREFKTLHIFGEIIAFLEKNFASSNITLGQLAKMANMSARNFQRSFKKTMGISPIQYLLKKRIEKACELLANSTDLSITEISFNTGFKDSNYFSRQFKNLTGMTPQKYRSINSIDDF